jgi:hypothetical protein
MTEKSKKAKKIDIAVWQHFRYAPAKLVKLLIRASVS